MRGIRITPGQHKISMQYHTPGLDAALMSSVLGLVIFGLAMILTRPQRRMVG